MKRNKIFAFLPCRKGSERVLKKNTRKFSDKDMGLIELKLEQLLKIREIDSIFLSTDDPDIISYASRLNEKKIIVDHRAESLCQSNTSTDDLISYVPSIIESGTILWTHTTSPFIQEDIYKKAIEYYFEKIKGDKFDSLMSVHKIQNFIWDENGPINYDRSKEKWPRTQTLKPLYEVNSGFFIADIDIYQKFNNRIGANPYLYVLNKITSTDIDWEEDFHYAEAIFNNRNLKHKY